MNSFKVERDFFSSTVFPSQGLQCYAVKTQCYLLLMFTLLSYCLINSKWRPKCFCPLLRMCSMSLCLPLSCIFKNSICNIHMENMITLSTIEIQIKKKFFLFLPLKFAKVQKTMFARIEEVDVLVLLVACKLVQTKRAGGIPRMP